MISGIQLTIPPVIVEFYRAMTVEQLTETAGRCARMLGAGTAAEMTAGTHRSLSLAQLVRREKITGAH